MGGRGYTWHLPGEIFFCFLRTVLSVECQVLQIPKVSRNFSNHFLFVLIFQMNQVVIQCIMLLMHMVFASVISERLMKKQG